MIALAGNIAISGETVQDSSTSSMDDTILTNFDKNLDSLAEMEYIDDSLLEETTGFVEIDSSVIIAEEFAKIPDSVFIQRLSSIPSVIDLSYNKIVRRFIEVYLTQRRDKVELMLGMADYYFPIFDDIFDYYDMPNEMKYMSIIESALNPRAVSRAGAVGLWQFMYGTGRVNGLTINSVVDERRDPVKSTHAAAKYSKKLYGIYDDWLMVIAAYNCGPGNVNKAIYRSGRKKNYWEIYYHLPRETRGHVPAFIAANYVMNFAHEHGLKPAKINMPPIHDTIMVMDKLHLKQVSEVLGISLDLIRDLNPQYRADIIPATPKHAFSLRLPEENIFQFIDRETEIFAYKDSVFFNPKMNQPVHTTSKYYSVPPPGNYTKLTYVVKSGDNLGFISEWYNVRISDIKRWNRIRRNTIYSGQKLAIYVPKKKSSKYKNINKMTFAEKQKMVGNPVPVSSSTSSDNLSTGDYILYTVKSGDTLWEIAQQYPGVTDTDIMQLNNIINAAKIKPGQKLKIRKKI